MKRTEIERRERELRRAEKKAAAGDRDREDKSVGDYINELHDLFIFNEERIFNASTDEEILELLEEIQDVYPDKAEVIMKKAIRKTKVAARDEAYDELMALLS